jgi:hypothetical protein
MCPRTACEKWRIILERKLPFQDNSFILRGKTFSECSRPADTLEVDDLKLFY